VSLSVPTRAELCWRRTEHPGDVQLRVAGELCVWTVSCIEPALCGLVADLRPATVTLDLSGVTFIDAQGVSLLSRLADHLAAWDGRLAITEASRVVTRLLVLVGMDRELHLGGCR
jgi:anti-anti-sigma factor